MIHSVEGVLRWPHQREFHDLNDIVEHPRGLNWKRIAEEMLEMAFENEFKTARAFLENITRDPGKAIRENISSTDFKFSVEFSGVIDFKAEGSSHEDLMKYTRGVLGTAKKRGFVFDAVYSQKNVMSIIGRSLNEVFSTGELCESRFLLLLTFADDGLIKSIEQTAIIKMMYDDEAIKELDHAPFANWKRLA